MELRGLGRLPVHAIVQTYAVDSGATPVSPIAGTTIIWGKLALYNGLTYEKNDEDGLWYPINLSGSGATTHPENGDVGITITP